MLDWESKHVMEWQMPAVLTKTLLKRKTVSFDFRDQRPQDELKNQCWTINLDNQKTKACDWIYPRYAEYESSFCMRSSVYQPPSTSSSSLERCVSLMRKICFWNSSSRDRKIKSKSITVKIHELILWLKFPFHQPWPSPVSGKWSCFQTHAFWAHEPTPKRACLCRQSIHSWWISWDTFNRPVPVFEHSRFESHIECMRRQLLLYDVLFQLINTQISDNVYWWC